MSSSNISIDMFEQSHTSINNCEKLLMEFTLADLDASHEPASTDDGHMNLKLKQMCGPSVRAYLLRKAKQLDDSQILDAVKFETAALCIWTMYKYQSLIHENNMVTRERINSILQENHEPNAAASNQPRFLSDQVAATQVLIDRCRKLPKEWTLVQICKGFNIDHDHSLMYDNHTANLPLNFTLFKYVRSDLLNDEPLRFNLKHDDFNFFKEFYDLSLEVNTSVKSGTLGADLEKNINDAISDIKYFMGPWSVMFSGRAKNAETARFEKRLFQMVDKFCDNTKSDTKYTARQRVLLSLVARRTDMLNNDLLEKAGWNISQNSTQCAELCAFLLKDVCELVNKQDSAKFAYYPTIAIVDELVDFIYWEMACPEQELARISSMALLFKLYDEYSEQVKDGYVRVKTDKGYLLCNPESNLHNSQSRLEPMFKAWYPHYNLTFGKPPASVVLKNELNATDVYIYAGHGSGLQFLGGRDVADCKLHCVAFLYGCQSVALKCLGTQSESTGTHLFLNFALCPAVVGALNITTDSWTDIVTLGINVMWLPSADTLFPLTESWWNLFWNYKRAIDQMKKLSVKDSLLEAMATIRCMKELPLRIRSVIVYRGLPVAH